MAGCEVFLCVRAISHSHIWGDVNGEPGAALEQFIFLCTSAAFCSTLSRTRALSHISLGFKEGLNGAGWAARQMASAGQEEEVQFWGAGH